MWRVLACLVAISTLATTAAAGSSAPFLISAPATWSSEERVAKPDQPLWTQPMTPIRWVRLEEGHDPQGRRRDRPDSWRFKPGQPLFGAWTEDGWVYCEIENPKLRFWESGAVPCFGDADGDGAFDNYRPSLGYSRWPALAPSQDKGFRGFHVDKPKPLKRPLRYSPLDPRSAPQNEIKIEWLATRPRGARRDTPPTGVVVFVFPGRTAHLQWIEGPVARTTLAADGTGRIEFQGALIEVLGISADGSLRYRVSKPIPAQVITFDIPRPPSTQTIYIYV